MMMMKIDIGKDDDDYDDGDKIIKIRIMTKMNEMIKII